ncbi:hypothetical protein [Chitinophaga sp. OAE865]|uniref:hypothetical protein n=1 Tax=Chitinophaga sp. OAE865 TaxID=2817898 RepID=UPI001AE32A05
MIQDPVKSQPAATSSAAAHSHNTAGIARHAPKEQPAASGPFAVNPGEKLITSPFQLKPAGKEIFKATQLQAAPFQLPVNTAAVVQRIETITEKQIPVQTHGNCGLFSIIAVMRAMGFDEAVQQKMTKTMDKFTSQSPDTFVGEIFNIDLMLQLINSNLKYEGKQLLTARTVSFKSHKELKKILHTYNAIPQVSLLIGYSKPDEYDEYYRKRGEWIGKLNEGGEKLEIAKSEMDAALETKVSHKDFIPQHAHWGMINGMEGPEMVKIADTIEEHSPDAKHGYNTNFRTDKLFNSNMSLASGKFDWSKFLDSDRNRVEYRKMKGTEKVKDLSHNERYKKIKGDKMEESMDLSGKLVVVELTAEGRELLAAKPVAGEKGAK